MSWSVTLTCAVCGEVADEGHVSDAVRPRISLWTLRRAMDHEIAGGQDGTPCGPVSVQWRTGPGEGREPGEGFEHWRAIEAAHAGAIVDMLAAAWRGSASAVRAAEARMRSTLSRLGEQELVDLRRNIKEALSEARAHRGLS